MCIRDSHYGWADACMERVGEVPTQICHEWNTATHVVEHEGRPARRPLSRAELQVLFDVADDAVAAIGRSGRRPGRRCGRILHLISETTRHAGHADATRELLDGKTGE